MSHSRYYDDLREFKTFFVRNCHISKKYEVFKIWAQWIIRVLSQSCDNYHPIPYQSPTEVKPWLIECLIEKGVDPIHAQYFNQQVMERLSHLYHTYHQSKHTQLFTTEQMIAMDQRIVQEYLLPDDSQFISKSGHLPPSPSPTISKRWISYRLGDLYVKFDAQIHERLLARYQGDVRYLKFLMFEMGFNYYWLDGHSFQWGIPLKVMSLLEKTLSVRTELFASPMNATLPLYYSLFYVDRFFGSLGNFFYKTDTHMMEGFYEVNPPFIEQLFIQSSQIMIDSLHQAQIKGRLLGFIYLMPNWQDSTGYQMLKHCGYLLDEVVLPEKGHFYRQSSKKKLISANFETHVLVVGTRPSIAFWTPRVREQFITHFTHY